MLWGRIARTLVVFCTLWRVAYGQPCKQSGYCSVGKVAEGVLGDIHQPGKLRTILEAISFKKEVILVTFRGLEYSFADLVAQQWSEFREFGFGHYLLLSNDQRECQLIVRLIPRVNCAWDTSPIGYGLGGAEHLWHLRWRFVARAARMGYNVMALDSDVALLGGHDPYVYLKRAPLSHVNVMTMEEQPCWCGRMCCNGGFMYVQNASPAGPATWMFKQVADIVLRWMDDGLQYINTLGRNHSKICAGFDQPFLDDALWSTLSGQVMTPKVSAWLMCSRGQWSDHARICVRTKHMVEVHDKINGACWGEDFKLGGLSVLQVRQNCLNALGCSGGTRTHDAEVPPPFEWGPDLRSNRTRNMDRAMLTTANMTLPRHNGFPSEFGVRLWPEQRGKYSRALLRQFQEDMPGEQMWSEDGAPSSGSQAGEVFGVVPRWLVSTMSTFGPRGLWQPPDGSEARAVIAHAHFVPTYRFGSSKVAMRKLINRYNWTLAASVYKQSQGGPVSPYLSRHPVQKVIALAPNLDIAKVARSREEYHLIVLGLMQLSVLSQRTALLPNIPCEADWVHADKGTSCDPAQGMVLSADHIALLQRMVPVEDLQQQQQQGGVTGRSTFASTESGDERSSEGQWQRSRGQNDPAEQDNIAGVSGDGSGAGKDDASAGVQQQRLRHRHRHVLREQARLQQRPTHYMVTPLYMLHGKCIEPHPGMIHHVEFEWWLQTEAPAAVRDSGGMATRSNTILFPGTLQNGPGAASASSAGANGTGTPAQAAPQIPAPCRPSWSSPNGLLQLDPRRVVELLDSKVSEPLLYVGSPVLMDMKVMRADLPREHNDFMQRSWCSAFFRDYQKARNGVMRVTGPPGLLQDGCVYPVP